MVDDKTLTTPAPEERQVIQSYGGGRFRISNAVYETAVIVLPDRTVAWGIADLAQLSAASLAPVGTGETNVDILLIGCGAKAVPISPDVRRVLRGSGVVIDVMDTGAACRTYNVLLAEGRRVAAALLPVA